MSLEDLRADVQKVDQELIRLIDERVRLAEEIFEVKRALGIGIEDKNQEKLVMKRALDSATELGLDAGAIKEVFTTLIRMSLEKQHELLGENNLP
ncbi:MAG TPA: chorismate mutase [Methanothrix sp.]|nr:chorismate mutase [Methanothrix sp.]